MHTAWAPQGSAAPANSRVVDYVSGIPLAAELNAWPKADRMLASGMAPAEMVDAEFREVFGDEYIQCQLAYNTSDVRRGGEGGADFLYFLFCLGDSVLEGSARAINKDVRNTVCVRPVYTHPPLPLEPRCAAGGGPAQGVREAVREHARHV